MLRIRIALAVVMASVIGVLAQDAPTGKQPQPSVDITGVWESTVESAAGTRISAATYKQDGETLTGTHSGAFGDVPLEGTVKGTAVSYKLTVEVQGQSYDVTYAGTVDGDQIIGTATLAGAGSGKWTVKRKK
jgi:hypothetical protein